MPKKITESNNNKVTLSVRIEKETDDKIKIIMSQTGQTKTKVVEDLLNNGGCRIVDGIEIAKGLFKIETLLSKIEQSIRYRNRHIELGYNISEIYEEIKESFEILIDNITELIESDGE